MDFIIWLDFELDNILFDRYVSCIWKLKWWLICLRKFDLHCMRCLIIWNGSPNLSAMPAYLCWNWSKMRLIGCLAADINPWAALIGCPDCARLISDRPLSRDRGHRRWLSRLIARKRSFSCGREIRRLVSDWSQIWVKWSGTPSYFGEANILFQKQIQQMQEFLMLRYRAIYGFWTFCVGGHLKRIFWKRYNYWW